jgi:DNA end-binding protein Ku
MAATVWKGHLSFGLVSIPVRLYRAARAEKVNFRQLARAEPPRERPGPFAVAPPAAAAAEEPETEPAPPPLPVAAGTGPVTRVRQVLRTEASDRPVERQALLKGYEYARDQYVVVDKEDLERITPKTSTVMQILEFVRLSEIDPVYYETSYYMAPERSGARAYAMLFEAMRRTGYAGLAQVAMHRREHIVIVRPGDKGILAHTMFYADEVRREHEYPADAGLVTPREMDLAVLFVESLAGRFEPEKYRDSYRAGVEALVAARLQGKETVEAPPPGPKAEVIDIVEALQRSLEATRKPSAREKEARPREAARKNRKRTRSGG